MWYALDRFEEEWAVLVDDEENSVTVERERLPTAARPGDLFRLEDGCYRWDEEETRARRQKITALEQKLRRKRE